MNKQQQFIIDPNKFQNDLFELQGGLYRVIEKEFKKSIEKIKGFEKDVFSLDILEQQYNKKIQQLRDSQ